MTQKAATTPTQKATTIVIRTKLNTRTKFILVMYLVGLCVLAGSLWWFRFVWLTTYSTQAYSSHNASFIASENTASHTLERPMGKPLIVHFIDKTCPCTRFSLPYIKDMQKTYAAPAVHWRIDRAAPVYEDKAVEALAQSLPASPAVAIWSGEGKLTYFGPYSTGAYCGDGEDMVQYVMEAFIRGDAIHWLNQEAQGCMCTWAS